MTDQTIPADAVREIAEKMHYHANHDNVRGSEEEYVRFFARQLDELLPPPPRPTLADMTTEERDACKWTQADVENRDRRPVIVNPYWDDETARIMWPHGFIEEIDWERITPRPDLPLLEWPADKKADPAPTPALPDWWRLADHRRLGRVIVTNPSPNSDGRVYYVLPSADPMGYDWFFCTPDDLTYIDTDQEDDQ